MHRRACRRSQRHHIIRTCPKLEGTAERLSIAGAESRRALEEAAAAAEKTVAEDATIEHAQIIYERRNSKQLPAFPEPKRGKAHWDHVLEEMNWMAKEFSK